MYQFVSSFSKKITGDKQWITDDISNIPFNVLFSLYSRILVVLSNPFIAGNVAVDLATIHATVGGLTITLNEFLLQNGNNSLTHMAAIPTLDPKYAKYNDAFNAKYKIDPIAPLASASAQLPIGDKTWLHMTKPGVDYALFHSCCLVNVNGFYHLTDADTTGIYVVDGMKSALKSKQNNIGIYSFREIGALSFIPIKPEMVYKQNLNQFYRDAAFVDLGIDVSTKTVMAVIGGYLHVLDNKTLSRVSPSAFRIDISNMPLLDRYYESEPYLDFSSLPLPKTARNPNQLGIPDFFSDENILAYLTLSQSFFVVLDNPNVFMNKIPVHKTKLPDMFISYVKPTYPLVVGVGKAANYWTTHEDGQYSLTCRDTLRHNYNYNTVDPTTVNSVGDNCAPDLPVAHSNPYFLEIGTASL